MSPVPLRPDEALWAATLLSVLKMQPASDRLSLARLLTLQRALAILRLDGLEDERAAVFADRERVDLSAVHEAVIDGLFDVYQLAAIDATAHAAARSALGVAPEAS